MTPSRRTSHSRPCLLLSVPHGGNAGNMLRAGLVTQILEGDPEITIVMFSPLVRDPAFTREFEHPRVRFEDLPAHRPHGLEARLLSIIQASYLSSGLTESVRIRLAEARKHGIVRWLLPKAYLGKLLVEPYVNNGSRYAVSDRLVSHEHYERLFDRCDPMLLVAANPGLILSEVPLLRTAARRRVQTMALDASWDNFTNKLLPVRQVDRLLVWNDLMREQAMTLHGYRSDQIRVVGAPQFDVYFRTGARSTRLEFFRRIRGEPSRKLITLTTTPPSLYVHHAHVLRCLIKAMENGTIAQPSQVLVRLHPRDELDAYREFAGVPHVIIEKPFRETVKVADGLAVDITAENQRHLADTLCHTDVVVNVASTITIEACIFDTPVVNIAFDGETESDFVASARRYYRFTHYVNITRHGAVRVAHSPGELTDFINAYLANPSLDAEARRRVVHEQCQFLDGRSGDRVAECVLGELQALSGRPMKGVQALEECALIASGDGRVSMSGGRTVTERTVAGSTPSATTRSTDRGSGVPRTN